MIYKSVDGIVWNARGGHGRVPPSEGPASAKLLEILAGMVSREEFSHIYEEWQRGERDIRADDGFIMMTFTPTADAPLPPAGPHPSRRASP